VPRLLLTDRAPRVIPVLFLYKLYKPYFTELSEQFSKLYNMTV
jgi:hypothetical protein